MADEGGQMRQIANQLIHEFTQWPILVLLLVSVLLALVIPPRLLQALPGSFEFLHAVTDRVPAIQDYIEKSRFPDIATVYFPIMFLLSPLHALWAWKLMSGGVWANQFAISLIGATGKISVILFLIFLTGFGSFIQGGGQLDIVPWNDSRIALAFGGTIATGGAFFILLVSLIIGIRSIWRRVGAKHG